MFKTKIDAIKIDDVRLCSHRYAHQYRNRESSEKYCDITGKRCEGYKWKFPDTCPLEDAKE